MRSWVFLFKLARKQILFSKSFKMVWRIIKTWNQKVSCKSYTDLYCSDNYIHIRANKSPFLLSTSTNKLLTYRYPSVCHLSPTYCFHHLLTWFWPFFFNLRARFHINLCRKLMSFIILHWPSVSLPKPNFITLYLFFLSLQQPSLIFIIIFFYTVLSLRTPQLLPAASTGAGSVHN